MALVKRGSTGMAMPRPTSGPCYSAIADVTVTLPRTSPMPSARVSGRTFRLRLDDAEAAAVRACVSCGSEHPVGDSVEYLADADLQECECPCGGEP